MPAVTIVPVLPLLLTVIVRLAAPRLIALVISVSPSAVPEPSTSEVVLAKPAVTPQVRSALAVAPTPSETTKRAGVPEANPAVLAKETVPVPATEAARERVNVEPPTSSTPPSIVIGLLVGIPTTAPLTTARSWPPLMVVMPVKVFEAEGLRTQRPASALVRDRASPALGLLRSRMRNSLSPREFPPKVNNRVPAPLKVKSAVFAKMTVALFWLPPPKTLLPYCPEDWIVAAPARVN